MLFLPLCFFVDLEAAEEELAAGALAPGDPAAGDPAAGVPGGGAAKASPHRVNPANHQYPGAFNRSPTQADGSEAALSAKS